jgi:hypothetical protein
VSDNQAAYPIATMCRLLGVSPSGYYAWANGVGGWTLRWWRRSAHRIARYSATAAGFAQAVRAIDRVEQGASAAGASREEPRAKSWVATQLPELLRRG